MSIFLNKKFRKTITLITVIIGLTILGMYLSGLYINHHIRYYPDYEKIDLIPILEKDELKQEDYKQLFYQTGLGPSAIDEIRQKDYYSHELIIAFQEDFFADTPYQSFTDGFVTAAYNVDEDGERTNGFNLAPYHNGYVFVTNASHTLGWRHGHSAIITDEESDETIEALTLGENSALQFASSWRNRPTFIMLRLKDVPQEKLNEIAEYARENLLDIPYNLTVGLFSPKNPPLEKLKGTHCSHLVWYPFMQFGYDIDSDGGWLVSPHDIMHSEQFEVVQIYGLDPDDFWRE